MGDKQKILVCGDVEGRFRKLFTKVESVNQKNGPFDLLLCVGNFFGPPISQEWQAYVNGTLTVPVPTYVLGPNNPEHVELYPDINGCELCPNVSYLGKRGLFSTSSGLKIAYLSGVPGEQGPTHFSAADVSAVRDACLKGQSNFRGIDILLTSVWPQGVVQSQHDGSDLVSWLAVQTKPRYHISGLQRSYYERAPYRNHDTGDNADICTRFISLSCVGNKEKWIYALNLTPLAKIPQSELAQRTTDETPCPYPNDPAIPGATSGNKREKMTQFFYDMSTPEENAQRNKRQKRETEEERQQRLANQAPCWFCLSSPQVEKHMVISVGSEVYMALAKGGLTPDHVLILPVGHHQAASQLPPEVLDELKKFKSALKKFFKKRYNKVVVFFERNFRTSHLQIQVVPVPSTLAGMVKLTFQECAEEQGLELTELPEHADLSQVAPPGCPYFHVELPGGEQLFMKARRDFPLQFGREVLASQNLLDMPERIDWKDCKISQDEEKELASKFREEFQPYDFTA